MAIAARTEFNLDRQNRLADIDPEGHRVSMFDL